MMTNVVFFGHHKCASTWMSTIFYEIQAVTGWTIHYGIDPSKKINVIGEAKISDISAYQNFRGVHLIRDPRDVIISGYYSHLKTHPTDKRPDILQFREKLEKLDFEEGLNLEMEFSKERLWEIGNWEYANANVLELRFEDFTQNPDWNEFFKFLELPVDDGVATYTLQKLTNKLNNRRLIPFRFNHLKVPTTVLKDLSTKYSFERLSKGRKQGDQDTDSHYRKGESGEWREVFSSEQKKHFKNLFPGLLEKLGYEQDESW